MSYNIDHVEIVASDGFCISRPQLEALRDSTPEDKQPESSFLDESFEKHCDEFRGMLFPKCFWWTGEGSGYTADSLPGLLAKFSGSCDLVITWEGGDSHSGLRLRNGVVTKHKVVLGLGDEETK